MGSFKNHCLDDKKLKQGVKLPLFDKDGGISDDYIMVRWAWDDKVRAVMDDLKRDLHIKYNADAKADASDMILDAITAQVAGWSFSEKATKSNVRKFLKARPDIADKIDTLSAQTKRFFTNSGKSS